MLRSVSSRKPWRNARRAEHPAYSAWKHIDASAPMPAAIDVLKERRDKAIYRMSGATRDGASVIIKRRATGKLAGEARLYADILAPLRLPAVHCYGYLDDLGGYSWLLLEDAGDHRYSPRRRADCALAIEWFARLHSTPYAILGSLGDCGPHYFRGVLDEAREGARRTIAHASMRSPFSADLAGILDHLDAIEREWTSIEAACARIPSTLVHCDFVEKNVRIRGSGPDATMVAFDWETAGAGTPACDIARIPGGADGRRAYFERLREVHPHVTMDDIERLFRIGRIFRQLHAIHWETYSLAVEWSERSLLNMATYRRMLRGVLRDPQWARG